MKKIISLGVVLAAAMPLAAKSYEIDPAHSGVMFRIKHLVSKVSGKFNKFEGTFDYDKSDIKSWKAAASIDTASIDTDLEARDKHLQSEDFFDAGKCPKITFVSTKVEDVKDNTAKVHGDLTMRCITKPVVLDIEFGGEVKNPWGKMVMGVSAKTKVNRKDFNINWNKTLDTGGFILGEEVEIMMDIEASPKEMPVEPKTENKTESKKKKK